MRGGDQKQEAKFSYIFLERRVPSGHPLRPVREVVDEVLKEMSQCIARTYARMGQPSIVRERLLNEEFAQAFFQIVPRLA